MTRRPRPHYVTPRFACPPLATALAGIFLALLTAPLVPAHAALTDEFKHEAQVMGRMGNHPNVVTFIGSVDATVTIATARDGESPLYEAQNHELNNPLYESAAPPGDPTGVASITFDLVTFGEP
ncbi:MAG: hypothetical protein AAGJ38_02605 [Planctomycetota bacterium]